MGMSNARFLSSLVWRTYLLWGTRTAVCVADEPPPLSEHVAVIAYVRPGPSPDRSARSRRWWASTISMSPVVFPSPCPLSLSLLTTVREQDGVPQLSATV